MVAVSRSSLLGNRFGGYVGHGTVYFDAHGQNDIQKESPIVTHFEVMTNVGSLSSFVES